MSSKVIKTGYYHATVPEPPPELSDVSLGIAPVESILQEAQRLVYGPRQATYGHPFDDFSRIGRVWAAVLGLPEVTPEQVALCMAGLKLCRLVGEPGHHDSIVDIAGYAGTYELVRSRR